MVGGSGLRPRLPGKSRLKTAPTIQKQPIQNYRVSLSIWLAAFQVSGSAYMKLHRIQKRTAKYPTAGPLNGPNQSTNQLFNFLSSRSANGLLNGVFFLWLFFGSAFRFLVPIYWNHIMFAHDLCHSQIEYLSLRLVDPTARRGILSI